jgi:hypothetical protein
VLRDRVSTGETTTDPTEGGTNGTRSAAAARWCELAGRVVVPPRSGLVFHLSSKLSQDVRWQLSVGVGLGDIVTKLGWMVVIIDDGWVLVGDRGLVGGNHRAVSGDVRWCSVWVLAPVKELGDGWVRLGTTRNLLRMSLGNTILVNWVRGHIVGKLAGGWGSRSGGLAGLDHVNSSSASNFLHVFRRVWMVKVVLAIVLHVLLILVLNGGNDDLNLTTKHQVEAVVAGGLLKTWKARSIVPLVQFPTKCVGFDLEHAKFASSN